MRSLHASANRFRSAMSEVSAQPQVAARRSSQPAAAQQPPAVQADCIRCNRWPAPIVIAIFVITFIVQAFQIPSESMEKTLLIGDYLLVDKAHYGQSPAVGVAAALSSDSAPGHHRVPLSGESPAALRQARGRRSRRSRTADQQARLREWSAAGRLLRHLQLGVARPVPRQLSRRRLVRRQDLGEVVSARRQSWWRMASSSCPRDRTSCWATIATTATTRATGASFPAENVVGRPLLIYWSMDRSDAAVADGVAV